MSFGGDCWGDNTAVMSCTYFGSDDWLVCVRVPVRAPDSLHYIQGSDPSSSQATAIMNQIW